MKTIAFYNEKGGVGKTTFSTLYSSWLRYGHNINVALVDFNNRMTTYRRDEISQKKILGIIDRYDLDNLWPIIEADKAQIRKLKKDNVCQTPNAWWLLNEIRNGRLHDYDILVIDLPGAAEGQEFMELLVTSMLSQICVILDRDPQTMRSSMTIQNLTKKIRHPNTIGFINQVQSYVSAKEYHEVAKQLMSTGMKILPDMISYTERIKKISEPDIIRSTLEYPDWSLKAFEGSKDLGIDNLFIDVTKELQKAKDIPNTRPADLSFVNKLEKEFQERRQLTGSSFPEYEFPSEMFGKR